MAQNVQTVIVTGGAGVVGSAIVRRALADGYDVWAADHDKSKLVELEQQDGGSGRLFTSVVDVTVASSIEELVFAAVAETGRLDALVQCAYWQEIGSAEELSEDGWTRTLDTTLKSIWLGARYAAPVMRNLGGGAVVNIASIQARIPFPRRTAYVAAKGGVAALTRELALFYAPVNIRFNSVLPGVVVAAGWEESADADDVSEMELRLGGYPLGFFVEPADVAAAVAFLISADARAITGIDLAVDAGLSIQPAEVMNAPRLRAGWQL